MGKTSDFIQGKIVGRAFNRPRQFIIEFTDGTQVVISAMLGGDYGPCLDFVIKPEGVPNVIADANSGRVAASPDSERQ